MHRDTCVVSSAEIHAVQAVSATHGDGEYLQFLVSKYGRRTEDATEGAPGLQRQRTGRMITIFFITLDLFSSHLCCAADTFSCRRTPCFLRFVNFETSICTSHRKKLLQKLNCCSSDENNRGLLGIQHAKR